MLNRRTFLGALAAPLVVGSLPAIALAEAPRLRMKDLYAGGDQLEFSSKAQSLVGTEIEIRGYMAPPLKVNLDFFILSDTPAADCPFCAEESDWVETIVFVQMRNPNELTTASKMIWTRGVLDIGTATDDETGFVSRVRLLDATFGTV